MNLVNYGIHPDINLVAPEGRTYDILAPLYIQCRQILYGHIEDQLDCIYHHGVDAWHMEIEVVKRMCPKLPDVEFAKYWMENN